jgi:hypothetical protein
MWCTTIGKPGSRYSIDRRVEGIMGVTLPCFMHRLLLTSPHNFTPQLHSKTTETMSANQMHASQLHDFTFALQSTLTPHQTSDVPEYLNASLNWAALCMLNGAPVQR